MRARHGYPVLALVIFLIMPDAVGARALPSGGRSVTTSRAPAIFDNSAHMDANNLDMFVTNHGSFGWDLSTAAPGLEFPKGTGKTALFAAGIWVGARVNGAIRTCVAEYSQEYSPGPMMNGTFQTDDPRFKSFKITRGNTTSFDYLNWPVQDGAPLDPLGRPALLGDAMIWSVYNDADPSLHTNSSAGLTEPLGLEIQQSTFAFNRSGPLGNVIFLKFKILNKGENRLDSTYVSFWADPDLGAASDDLVGCDTTLSLGYCYNETNNDTVYGSTPPAIALDFLRGPVVQVSPGAYDTLGMTSFRMYINGQDPRSATEAYQLMQGLKKDGTPLHVNGDSLQPITTFEVSGDPVTGTGWLDGDGGDRRFMVSSGPFLIYPGDVQEIEIAVIIGQGGDRLSSIAALRSAVPIIRDHADGDISLVIPARVDLDPNVINLNSHAPTVTAYIESPGFSPTSIDVSSLRLAGSVPARAKIAAVGDHDRNGIPDLMVKFSRSALDPLLTPGVNSLELTGSLITGESFVGTDEVGVIDNGGANKAASVAPNPLNPSGMLSFSTVKPGHVRIVMFDLHGRLVRTLMEVPLLPAGQHAVRIDGRGEQGEVLPSGVYFYQLDSPHGTVTGRFAILK